MEHTEIALEQHDFPVPNQERWRLAYDKDASLWGLIYFGSVWEWTHMRYGMYADPAEIAADESRPRFYFDVGRDISVTREEMGAAFRRLGLIDAE